MEGNDHLGPALAYFDSVKHYPGAASRGNGGAALRTLPMQAQHMGAAEVISNGGEGAWDVTRCFPVPRSQCIFSTGTRQEGGECPHSKK